MNEPRPPAPPPEERLVMSHALLIAMTALIPLPLADELAKRHLRRRLVERLAEAHALKLWPEEIAILADEEGAKTAGGLLKNAALLPVRFVLRKAFIVIASSKMIGEASAHYHRGWLVDRAFAHGWCSPHGRHDPQAVRRAIEQTLATAPVATSPVTTALQAGLEQSKQGLEAFTTFLADQLQQTAKASPSSIANAIERSEEQDASDLTTVVDRLQATMTEGPNEHLRTLERHLAKRLGEHLPEQP